MTEESLSDIAGWILHCGFKNPQLAKSTIHFAAFKGYVTFVKKLLADGVNVDSKDFSNNHETPLMYAAKSGHLEVVKLLIENKADFEYKDAHKRNALYRACEFGHLEIVKFLMEIGANIHCECTYHNINPLACASRSGHTKVVELLLQNGADVNSIEYHKLTPLYRASESGHVETAELLIKNGADINFQDTKTRFTALHIASKKGHYEVVRLLLKHGAEVDCLMEGGWTWTPLLLAINDRLLFMTNEQTEVVSLLIEYNANQSVKLTDSGDSALELVLDTENKSVLKVMLYQNNK